LPNAWKIRPSARSGEEILSPDHGLRHIFARVQRNRLNWLPEPAPSSTTTGARLNNDSHVVVVASTVHPPIEISIRPENSSYFWPSTTIC
jgi:hypothetical protein